MVVVRKIDEDVEAMQSTSSGMYHSFGCAESESLGSETKNLNTGVFSMGRLEQLRTPHSREGGYNKG